MQRYPLRCGTVALSRRPNRFMYEHAIDTVNKITIKNTLFGMHLLNNACDKKIKKITKFKKIIGICIRALAYRPRVTTERPKRRNGFVFLDIPYSVVASLET